MKSTTSALIAAALVGLSTAATAQDIPEISARCQAENARLSALIQAQCLPLQSVAEKMSCTRRARIASHADAGCMAESRAHVVALQHACLMHTAPTKYESAGICQVAREHPTAFTH